MMEKERVMCRDCMYRAEKHERKEWYWCDKLEVWTDDGDFCSMGREKSNESKLLTESAFPDFAAKLDSLRIRKESAK